MPSTVSRPNTNEAASWFLALSSSAGSTGLSRTRAISSASAACTCAPSLLGR